MRILLIGFGSRGDVQPLLALGHGLRAAGCEVVIAAAADFQRMVTHAGLAYARLRTDMQALMSGDSGTQWIENSSASIIQEARNMRRMIDEVGRAFTEDLMGVAQDAEVLISGLSSYGTAQAIAEKFGKRHIVALYAPLTPTASHAATIAPMLPRVNSFLNRLSGYIAQYFTYWIFKPAVNQFRESLGLKAETFGRYARTLNRAVPIIYGVSPLVMPRPADWRPQVHVTGHWYYDAPPDWQPSHALQEFLAGGPPPVYIGLGSMASKNPEATTRIMVSALQQAGWRGVIHSGWAGLHSADLPEDIFLLDDAPHDWLFPRMAAVVHHGGAGTTAAALRAGVPSSIISHMADQPYWGRRVHELGVGGPLIRRHRLTPTRLARVIRQITANPAFRVRAQALAAGIRQEDGVARAAEVISRALAT